VKIVAITQRVDAVPGRDERRDALDGNWNKLLHACDCLGVPMPNHAQSAVALWHAAHCEGLILSGGNDLAAYGGDAPERDETEARLLDLAGAQAKPVLGVCRGMQFLVAHAGGKLHRVEHHVACRHKLDNGRDVNSYHGWAAQACPPDWTALAHSPDGALEMMRHGSRRWLGIMWHPERERPFAAEDLTLIGNWFHGSNA
jgi:gamma-glutamyl-gamma-aminobutyrate hydrolase PuuD